MEITRNELAALVGEDVAIFDCHECADGFYVGPTAETALCTRCGASMPEYVRQVAKETSAANNQKVA